MTKKNWFIKRGPEVARVASAEVEIDDHLGPATVMATEWANGEGFDVFLQREKEPEQRLGITWCEWIALKKVMRAIEREMKRKA